MSRTIEEQLCGEIEVRQIRNRAQFEREVELLYTEDSNVNIIYEIVMPLRSKWFAETNKYCAWYLEQKKIAEAKDVTAQRPMPKKCRTVKADKN